MGLPLPTWIKETVGFILLCSFIGLLAVNLKGCADVSVVEGQVKKLDPFYLHGREYVCRNTSRQLEVDKLYQQINNIRGK